MCAVWLCACAMCVCCVCVPCVCAVCVCTVCVGVCACVCHVCVCVFRKVVSLSSLDLVKGDRSAGECVELDWETPPQLLHHSKAIQYDGLPALHTRIIPAAARES